MHPPPRRVFRGLVCRSITSSRFCDFASRTRKKCWSSVSVVRPISPALSAHAAWDVELVTVTACVYGPPSHAGIGDYIYRVCTKVKSWCTHPETGRSARQRGNHISPTRYNKKPLQRASVPFTSVGLLFSGPARDSNDKNMELDGLAPVSCIFSPPGSCHTHQHATCWTRSKKNVAKWTP